MKNYEATRSKIKLYLNALKERFSTSEWKEYHASEICKEFGITVTLPQILKNEGYYHYEHKNGIPSMMLSQKIMLINEILAHNKIREYCNLSKERTAIKQLQNKEKDKIKKKRLDAKAANKSKKEKYLQNQFTNRGFVQEGYKTLSIKVGKNFYKKMLIHCEKNDLTIAELIARKLVAGEVYESQDNLLDKLNKLNNPQFKDSTRPTYKGKLYKSVKPIRQANELIEKLDEIEGAYYPKTKTGVSNQETLKMIRKYHQPEIEQTDAETKLKSLETIMNLFLKGIINEQELENLKKGILNK